MKFYLVEINNIPACVIHDQMADSDIQAAIEQELDCLGLELETVSITNSMHTLGSRQPGELVLFGLEHDYGVMPITVHGVNPVTGQVN